jgi:ribosomal protein S18 acetylase RimI-like enzyme
MSLVPWTSEQKEAFLKSQFLARERHYSNAFEQPQNLVMRFDARPVGRLFLSRTKREIRIVDLAILPEYRGRGIGSGLVRDLQREATDDSRKLTGSVDRFSRAVNFWRRQGFEITESPDIYLPMEWSPAS